ncbi:MAG: OmpA family protein, partial [Pseudomonadota bacterium]|nr:OmpA family protein [Pseudomonadota bacterium]
MKGMKALAAASVVAFGYSASGTWADTAATQFQNSLKGTEEFLSHQTDLDKYELVLGKPTYQYPSSPEEVEGFKAESSRVFEGQIERKVFDLQAGIGTLKAISSLKNIIYNEGLRVLYSCEQLGCGPIKGWSVYYPEQADGSQSDQYYLSAVYPEEGPPERILAAHVSRVGRRTRITIDEVDVLIDVKRSIQNYANAIMDYWSKEGFDRGLPVAGYRLGSSELTETMKLKYKAIATLVNGNPGISVKLFGYTDRIGDRSANEELSLERARKVAEFLGKLGAPEEAVEFYGLGIFDYANSEDIGEIAPEHRKVLVLGNPVT